MQLCCFNKADFVREKWMVDCCVFVDVSVYVLTTDHCSQYKTPWEDERKDSQIPNFQISIKNLFEKNQVATILLFNQRFC